MSAQLTVLASLGIAILLSPEILVLGLIMACDRRSPRLSALLYAVGAAIGLVLGLAIGSLVAPPAPAAATPAAPTWGEFIVRVLIAGLLVGVGVQRAINAFRNAPIDTEAEARPDGKPKGSIAGLKARLASLFPGGGAGELTLSRRAARAIGLGFATMGLHPKCVSVAIAAGHQAMQIPGEAARMLGFTVFAVIAMIPAIAPLAIELVRPGASASIKESCERFMKRNGRWIVAVILLAAGAYVASNAVRDMPRDETVPAVAPKA